MKILAILAIAAACIVSEMLGGVVHAQYPMPIMFPQAVPPAVIDEVPTSPTTVQRMYWHLESRTYSVGSKSWPISIWYNSDGKPYWNHGAARAMAYLELLSYKVDVKCVYPAEPMTFGAVDPISGRR